MFDMGIPYPFTVTIRTRTIPPLVSLLNLPVLQVISVKVEVRGTHSVFWASENVIVTVFFLRSTGNYVPTMVITSPPTRFSSVLGVTEVIVPAIGCFAKEPATGTSPSGVLKMGRYSPAVSVPYTVHPMLSAEAESTKHSLLANSINSIWEASAGKPTPVMRSFLVSGV